MPLDSRREKGLLQRGKLHMGFLWFFPTGFILLCILCTLTENEHKLLHV